jgi:hypothetical protein
MEPEPGNSPKPDWGMVAAASFLAFILGGSQAMSQAQAGAMTAPQ